MRVICMQNGICIILDHFLNAKGSIWSRYHMVPVHIMTYGARNKRTKELLKFWIIYTYYKLLIIKKTIFFTHVKSKHKKLLFIIRKNQPLLISIKNFKSKIIYFFLLSTKQFDTYVKLIILFHFKFAILFRRY